MDAKCAPLPDDPVQEERRGLRNAIVFDEEFLKLIHHDEAARQRFGALGLQIPGQILRAQFAEGYERVYSTNKPVCWYTGIILGLLS